MRCKIEISITEPDTSDERYQNREKTIANATVSGELEPVPSAELASRVATAALNALAIVQGEKDGDVDGEV